MGSNCERFEEFLDNKYALKNEMWYVMDARKGAFLHYGFKEEISGEEFKRRIEKNTLLEVDYDRTGADGKKRELHIEKALDVTKRAPAVQKCPCYPHVADCVYFTVDKINLDGNVMKKLEGFAAEKSFVSILILDGEGRIRN